jgi:polysaccharide export outer membrane protein
LLVAVYNHPELSLAQYIGMNVACGTKLAATGSGGRQRRHDTVSLIGTVSVAGKTLNELRVFLEHELGKFIKDPKVTVQITFPGSIRYYFVGQFTQPGVKYSDRPLRCSRPSRSAAASCSTRRACAALTWRAAASACQ